MGKFVNMEEDLRYLPKSQMISQIPQILFHFFELSFPIDVDDTFNIYLKNYNFYI